MADDVTIAPTSGQQDVSIDVPVYTLGETKIPFKVLKYIPEDSAIHYQIAPLSDAEGVLGVGMIDPDNMESIDALNFIARSVGMPFKLYRITREDFERIVTMYRGLGGEVERAVSDLESEQKETTQKDKSNKNSEKS